jgi:hypothetical protein
VKKVFSFTFFNKFVEIYQLFPVKQLTTVCKKAKKFQNFSGKICFLWSRYEAGPGTGTITFSKVGTGTITS